MRSGTRNLDMRSVWLHCVKFACSPPKPHASGESRIWWSQQTSPAHCYVQAMGNSSRTQWWSSKTSPASPQPPLPPAPNWKVVWLLAWQPFSCSPALPHIETHIKLDGVGRTRHNEPTPWIPHWAGLVPCHAVWSPPCSWELCGVGWGGL